ncbi:SsrA-binding protein SmpB [Varunaivibrio sulfuroxidans]|uniref:SsrA-binding protein n=1 Tax=Varunaivibrio sulfuroxidans TaxID=1773489 RepID=A0A4R3JFF4_9PROT|nr:SsrA-binding protein SmpB [Varunaivibrio sulfuroxidans]TCS64215.1 SsrA-binding protein [Varunaivibrio sulfuroxidans]WES31342.1 SsrA-binding protein SmpB [Varunaivibrio sulfuroxidans]
MAGKNRKKKSQENVVAQNRKARHDYFIEKNFELGIMLAGSEVKSLRQGHATIAESYATEKDGELWLINAYIPEYDAASHFGHENPRRPRKLLAHRREIETLSMAVRRDGMTLVPLSIYFNDRGVAKVDVGLAKGKTRGDKRETTKERDWKRDKARLLRAHG